MQEKQRKMLKRTSMSIRLPKLKCYICEALRDDRDISQRHYQVKTTFGIISNQTVNYCNDNIQCIIKSRKLKEREICK